MTFPRLIDDGSVWIVVIPPAIWAGHFLSAYWIAAVWCAAGQAGLAPAAWAILGLTVLALAGIGWTARVAAVRYGGRLRSGVAVSGDAAADRRRFLGHVALLLCALSVVAVIFTALPALVFDRC